MITRKELIKKYIEFFKKKGHKEIENSSLVPKGDPTVLFTTAGMHPLVPYLIGQGHPHGKRLVNVQRCLRTDDIDEVGDLSHGTFFEMLGNWSLGDYWKKEAIEYSLEFLTKELKIPKEKISVTCFKGDKDAPKDTESEKIWKSLGIKKIKFLGKKDNWWGPTGKTGPCGPDTEMFVNGFEIGNDVLMQYYKDKRLILVDGMHCVYNENFEVNKELLDIINDFNSHTILVVNKFREKGGNLVKSHSEGYDTNWKAFSLEESEIKKDNQEYFKTLLKRFDLNQEEVMYFDHDRKNVETAKKLGILSRHYTDNKSIKKFIEDNLYCFKPSNQKNIDFGGGVERMLSVLNELNDNYMTDVFKPIIETIEKLSGKKYGKNKEETKAMRIIADHIKASVFIIADGIIPSNTEQGYVLRRLIRRTIRYKKQLEIKENLSEMAKPVFDIYNDYEYLTKLESRIIYELDGEEQRFTKTLEQGEKVLLNLLKEKKKIIDGKTAFLLYQSYGFPLELIEETAKQHKIKVDIKSFEQEQSKHQKLSQTAAEGKFKSGLADNSETTTKLHTAHHLLLEALRKILNDKNILQKGSNITPKRLRLDFSFSRKLTGDEIKKVESLVNEQIRKTLPITRKEMSPQQALKQGALGVFGDKYGEVVSVYTIGNFSKEICTGPHVKNTKELGHFKILKEESSSQGVRRIKAILE